MDTPAVHIVGTKTLSFYLPSKTFIQEDLNSFDHERDFVECLRLAFKAKKNKGNENRILPPTARIMAINKDRIISKFLKPFAIFLLFLCFRITHR